MRILVTGGAGFQGSNLCRALLNEGYRVTIFNTWSERSVENLQTFGLQKAEVIWGSITDPDSVEKALRDHDLVFHLAANIHVDESIREPQKYYRTNVWGTYNVVSECRRNGTPMIHVSTCEVYGGCDYCSETGCDKAITESCCLMPQSPYAASKAAADSLCFAHATTYGQPLLIVRPFNVFGPGQRYGTRGAVIPIFVRKALRGEEILIYGDGQQGRDFVYIRDLVRAYVFLIHRFLAARVGRIVNVGTGKDTTVQEIAHQVVKLTGSNSPIAYGPPRLGEVTTFRADSSVLQKMGFTFRHPFADGLREYIDWCREVERCESV